MHSMQEQVKERLMFPVLRNNETRDRNKDWDAQYNRLPLAQSLTSSPIAYH